MTTIIDLATLTPAQGFKITGVINQRSGDSGLASAGDINGDGIDDIVVGAFGYGDVTQGHQNVGGAYIIYGKAGGVGNIDLGHLQSTQGFFVSGVADNTRLGLSVAGIGDVNHDGIADFAFSGDGVNNVGETVVVFGKVGGYSNFDLNALSGKGAIITGSSSADLTHEVSAAGDFNNDGKADFLIGAQQDNTGGTVYVVFGQDTGNFNSFNLGSLGSNGVIVTGLESGSTGARLARVGSAGDFNHDGVADIIVGAPYHDTANGADSGAAYVLFGKSGISGTINVSTLTPTQGLTIIGDAAGHHVGNKVSSAGDVNHDGFTDVIVSGNNGFTYGSNGGYTPADGAAYVIFGRSTGGTINLNGFTSGDATGFKIVGSGGELAGASVSAAGDLNGDGFGDIVIGAPFHGQTPDNYGYPSGYSGAAYVIFGKASGFHTIDLANLAPSDGFEIKGLTPQPGYGYRGGNTVSAAGDLNHDGAPDIIVSAHSDAAYVIYGTPPTSGTDATLTTNEDTALTLSASNFGFTTSQSVTLTAVTITTTPTHGTLKDNGVAVTANQSVSIADINAGKLVFTPDANANGNAYATFTFQVQDSGGGTDSTPNTLTFNVNPVNDAPTATATAANPIFTENNTAGVQLFSAFSADTVEQGQAFSNLTLTISNVESGHDALKTSDGTLVLTNGASLAGAHGITETVSITGSTATVTFAAAAGINAADLSALVQSMKYVYQGEDPSSAARVVTLTSLKDNGGTANGGVDTVALNLSSTVQITPVNDAPTATATAANPTFTENDTTGVQLFSAFSPSTVEQGQTFSNLTLTITNVESGHDALKTSDGTLVLTNGATMSGANGITETVSISGSTATVNFGTTTGISAADLSSLVQSMKYLYQGEDPSSAARVVTLTSLKDNGGTANGGVDTATLNLSSTVQVTPVNDAPTATATATNPTFTESGSAVQLFSAFSASTIESSQAFSKLTLTITNIESGHDALKTSDGTLVLTNGATLPGAHGITESVSISGTTATVTFVAAAGISAADLAALVQSMNYLYQGSSPTTTDRVVTLTGLQDNGGTANGGVDTATLSLASTVHVQQLYVPPPPPPPPTPVTYDASQINQAAASNFTASDTLTFPAGVSAGNLSVTPTANGITLILNGQPLTFPDAALSAASKAGHLVFADGSHLVLGQNGSDNIQATTDAPTVIYGLGGDDSVAVGNAHDVVNGGTGSDTVVAGNGNNHIWGNAQTTQQGSVDGNDVITVGSGSNYINGNAGDDVITAGTDGSSGDNRLLGGSGNDTVSVRGNGVNYVNGNTGNDVIDGSNATGNSLLRGGQGDDVVKAGRGQDQIMGDLGNDTLVAGSGSNHITVMTGGAGSDLFDFSSGPQSKVVIGNGTYFQEVTDFTPGSDHVRLGFTVGSSDVITASQPFSDAMAAEAYAQQQLSSHGNTTGVVALQVGTETFLFFNASGTSAAIDSVVRLDHVTASTLSAGDFVH